MTDFQRLLETQNFKSEVELKKFMDGIVGQRIPSFPKESLNSSATAQDLVYEAYDLSPAKAKANIEKALQLDPDCIEAFEFLGSSERTVEIAMTFFEKGISIGRKLFGGKYLAEHKGMFWGFHETRPFMRCLQHYSDCLYAIGKVRECIAVLEEMIKLNPNDNQGVRDQLLLYLIQMAENDKFNKYEKQYKDDDMAFSLFNRALFAFKTEGDSKMANEKLKNAIKGNKFVVSKLLANKPLTDLPEHYGFGDDKEAKYYVYFAYHTWHNTEGSIEWLRKQTTK